LGVRMLSDWTIRPQAIFAWGAPVPL